MFIRIIDSSLTTYWYDGLVGKEFEVLKYDEINKEYVVKNINGNGDMGSVMSFDCIEVETIFEADKFINPPLNKTEIILNTERITAAEDAINVLMSMSMI